jgi:hypothetical protein
MERTSRKSKRFVKSLKKSQLFTTVRLRRTKPKRSPTLWTSSHIITRLGKTTLIVSYLHQAYFVDAKKIQDIEEQLKALLSRPISTGGNVDMNLLNQTFASKLPPDNTIKRIEELEKL